MSDLTTRLLAEIERREARAEVDFAEDMPLRAWLSPIAKTLTALRQIVEMHRPRQIEVAGWGDDPADITRTIDACTACGTWHSDPVPWPCQTIAVVAAAVEVEIGDGQ